MRQHDLLSLRRYLDSGHIRTGSGPRPRPNTDIEVRIRNGGMDGMGSQVVTVTKNCTEHALHCTCANIPGVVLLLGSRWRQTESNI